MRDGLRDLPELRRLLLLLSEELLLGHEEPLLLREDVLLLLEHLLRLLQRRRLLRRRLRELRPRALLGREELLRERLLLAHLLGAMNTDDVTLCALASSEYGEAVLKKFRFVKQREAHEMPDGWPLYVLRAESAAALEAAFPRSVRR